MKGSKPSCEIDYSTNLVKCIQPDGNMVFYQLKQVPSSVSLQIKDSAIDEMISKKRKCFDSGKCKPIDATFFSLDSCPHCVDHSSVLENVKKIFEDAKIPITVTKKNARESLNEFKSIGCNGTPCVSVSRGKERVKLYEGNKGEIGVIADMLGLPNPLFKNKR